MVVIFGIYIDNYTFIQGSLVLVDKVFVCWARRNYTFTHGSSVVVYRVSVCRAQGNYTYIHGSLVLVYRVFVNWESAAN